jgi:hypothetical protein
VAGRACVDRERQPERLENAGNRRLTLPEQYGGDGQVHCGHAGIDRGTALHDHRASAGAVV